jgi:cytidyltransferase-like protein
MSRIFVSGPFDDIRSHDLRLLQEAANFGPVTVALWADEVVRDVRGTCKFPYEERRYVLEAVRYVERVVPVPADAGRERLDCLSEPLTGSDAWTVLAGDVSEDKVQFCQSQGARLITIRPEDLDGYPSTPFDPAQMAESRPRVIVTGCYDWFHSGHVRFFEECSQLGDLYVVAGNDANVRLLKGEGHPLFPEDERRYVVGSCRYVKQALISTGMGWMDAEPEVALVRPHMYAVNEDGDKPEKRAFCAEHGIEYVILKRTPKEGLPRRSSTDLRGF